MSTQTGPDSRDGSQVRVLRHHDEVEGRLPLKSFRTLSQKFRVKSGSRVQAVLVGGELRAVVGTGCRTRRTGSKRPCSPRSCLRFSVAFGPSKVNSSPSMASKEALSLPSYSVGSSLANAAEAKARTSAIASATRCIFLPLELHMVWCTSHAASSGAAEGAREVSLLPSQRCSARRWMQRSHAAGTASRSTQLSGCTSFSEVAGPPGP